MSSPRLIAIGRLSSFTNGIPLSDSWRITSSKTNDIIWNVVLTYLNSLSPSNENELTERIKCLGVEDQKIIKDIKNSMDIYDPFFNLNKCFMDKEMTELVSTFTDRVEIYLKQNEVKLHDEPKNFRYLEASSKLLSCNIVLISFPCPSKAMVVVFPVKTFSNQRTIYSRQIKIFDSIQCTNGVVSRQNEFSICIPNEIGIEKQRWALKKILGHLNVIDKDVKISKISELPDITENFLGSLLKGDFGQVIPLIFKSSYSLLKLADAGIQIDSMSKDREGKSAFFYAFKTEKWDLVNLFYTKIANNCLQTDASILSPDPIIAEKLLHIKNFLKQLENDLESEKISENAKCRLFELYRLNEFQIEMQKNINNINLKINCYDHTEEEYEVLKRKETILTILKTYESYIYNTRRETF